MILHQTEAPFCVTDPINKPSDLL